MNAPHRPFIILTPAEASDAALVARLRRSGCELRVRETPGGPAVPIEEWLKK